MGLAFTLQPNTPECNAFFLRLPHRRGVVCVSTSWRMPNGQQMLEVEVERPWARDPEYLLFDPYDGQQPHVQVIDLPAGTTQEPVLCVDALILPPDRLRLNWAPPKRDAVIYGGKRDERERVSVHIEAAPTVEIVRLEVLLNRGINLRDYFEYARLSERPIRDVRGSEELREWLAAAARDERDRQRQRHAS